MFVRSPCMFALIFHSMKREESWPSGKIRTKDTNLSRGPRMIRMKGICPNCGCMVEIQRRPPGRGSEIDPSKPLNENEVQLVEALKKLGGRATIRQILAYLFGNKLQRNGRPWNAHYAQRDMSYVVGRGLVQMIKVGKSFEYVIPVLEVAA